MADSDSSSLSEYSDKEMQKLAPIFIKARKATKLVAPPPVVSPPRPKREPSPPHETVMADDPDIAFIIMFRSRFSDAMSTKLPHFGPQDIERGIVDSVPTPQVQHLLCALLGLALNRKKPVERGHHGRALEEAVLSHKSQWPRKWQGQNPLHGGKNFENMTPAERLNLLRTLIMWALSSSEAIQASIKEKYKQTRHQDDENQPLSVQPWGIDGDRRRYFLIQGLDDTSFRVYREHERYTKRAQWRSQAGSIEEVKALAQRLQDRDRSQPARRLAAKITNAIPMFEATEEKRRRREYRQVRRAAFSRPEPGFSLYEGRTRGKRMRYTYDDDDSFLSDDTSTRRSTRQSGRTTPQDNAPTYTASGRQIRAPKTGDYGESLLSGAPTSGDEGVDGGEPGYSGTSAGEDSEQPVQGGRARRSAGRPAGRPAANGISHKKRKNIDGYNDIDEMSDEDDAGESGDEWDSGKSEGDDEDMAEGDDEDMAEGDVYADDEDDAASQDEEDEDEEAEADEEDLSLIVRLKVPASRADAMAPARDNALLDTPDNVPERTSANVPNVRGPLDSVNNTDHPASSPREPSAYPTPTSASFMPAEQKSALATAPLPPQPNLPGKVVGSAVLDFAMHDEAPAKPLTGLQPNGVLAGKDSIIR